MKITPSLILSVSTAAAVAMLSACKPAQPVAKPPATPKPAAEAAPAVSTPTSTEPAVTQASAGPELKDPVAVVNGEPITKAQLLEAFNSAVKSAGSKMEDLTPEQKLDGYHQLLDDLIMEKLVTKASEGVVVPEAEVDAEIAKIKAQFPSEEEFNKQIVASGQSPEKLKEALTKMLQQQKWMEGKVGGETKVTEADAKKFYDENKKEFEEPATVKASHILILVNKDDSEEVVKEKLALAKKAAARAKKEDFAKVAKELSEEPGAKESGGDLGYFSKDKMVPEFADAAFSQKVGQVGEPVRTQFGWHVIKVTDTKPAGTASFDEVKKQLMAYLEKDKQRKAVQALLKSMHDSAKIENTLPPAPAPAPAPAAAPASMPMPADQPGS
jgi:parvulin-like peptidyl-prolyl isomerase